jgi:hypothetical protein
MYRYHEDRPKPQGQDYRRPFERAQYLAACLTRGGATLIAVLTLSPHELVAAIVTLARMPSPLTGTRSHTR